MMFYYAPASSALHLRTGGGYSDGLNYVLLCAGQQRLRLAGGGYYGLN